MRTLAVPVAGTGVRLAVDEHLPAEDARAHAIFLPGFGSHRRGTKATRLGRRLAADGVRLLTVDFEGHGDSTGRFASLSLSRHRRDAAAVRDRLVGDAPVSLIGSSMGGLVAAMAAAEDATVERLVLIAPAFGFRARWESRVGRERIDAWREAGTLEWRGDDFTAEIEFEMLADARRVDEAAVVAAIACPTLLVHGTDDDTVPIEEADRFAAACRAPLVYRRIERGTHRLEGALDRLEEEVASFLAPDRAPPPGSRTGTLP